jgi:hypothetical protein
MHYAYPSKVFLSDNCNCGKDELDAADVICKVLAAVYNSLGETGVEYFVRQTYLTDDAAFVTLHYPPGLILIQNSILNRSQNPALNPTIPGRRVTLATPSCTNHEGRRS